MKEESMLRRRGSKEGNRELGRVLNCEIEWRGKLWLAE